MAPSPPVFLSSSSSSLCPLGEDAPPPGASCSDWSSLCCYVQGGSCHCLQSLPVPCLKGRLTGPGGIGHYQPPGKCCDREVKRLEYCVLQATAAGSSVLTNQSTEDERSHRYMLEAPRPHSPAVMLALCLPCSVISQLEPLPHSTFELGVKEPSPAPPPVSKGGSREKQEPAGDMGGLQGLRL
ncbi:hypothetical protein DPEC_G00264580 [Dallia pectoralis]|uniref:Uncharacterized protein n=1 Tax=Dallia pectoralis TaxID=75939 RepID=A0ACC2FS68_DALPE|nr:hypothetical protein DPEC_G00264580 [Dallia pectoralis]